MKIVDKILTIIAYILTIAPYLILGAYSADSAARLFTEENIGGELIAMGAFLFAAVLFLLLHIILHEGGHMVMGLATGWKFSSFRIGSLTLVKQNDKLKWKKTTVMGTGGQCLMIPPECEPEKCPFFLYLLGGGLMNILLGGLAFIIAIPLDGVAEILLTLFAIVGIGTGITNLFPAKIGGTMNDGYQIFIELPHNPKARTAQYCLLSANAILYEVESTGDMPEKLREIILNFDYSNLSDTGTTNLLLYKGTILQEEGRYDELRAIFERINESNETLEIFKREAKCELIYLEIMGECNAEKIDGLMDNKQSDYIKSTALYPSRKRLMYAYYLIYKDDEKSAEKEYNELIKTAETHPSKAEGAIELKEAERVRAYYDERRSKQEA